VLPEEGHVEGRLSLPALVDQLLTYPGGLRSSSSPCIFRAMAQVLSGRSMNITVAERIVEISALLFGRATRLIRHRPEPALPLP